MIPVCLVGQVKSVLEEILEKLPEEYDVAEMAAKTTQRSPYVLVCFQECERMNLLLAEMRRSLGELALGLKVLAAAYQLKRLRSQGFNQRDRVCVPQGELSVSSSMEGLQSALFTDSVPESWARMGCPSTKTLAQW